MNDLCRRGIHRVTFVVLVCFFCICASAWNSRAQTLKSIDVETFETWMQNLSNWGRWGEDDQLGTLNLITPEKRREALTLPRDGESVSLAHDVETEPALDNTRPFEMTMGGLDDAGLSVVTNGPCPIMVMRTLTLTLFAIFPMTTSCTMAFPPTPSRSRVAQNWQLPTSRKG